MKIIHILIFCLDLTLSKSLGRGRSGYEINQIYDVRDVMDKSDEDNETYYDCFSFVALEIIGVIRATIYSVTDIAD